MCSDGDIMPNNNSFSQNGLGNVSNGINNQVKIQQKETIFENK